MNVKEIVHSASPPMLVPIIPKDYAWTKSWIKSSIGVELPLLDDIYCNEGTRTFYCVMCDIQDDIIWDNGSVWRVIIKKGTLTDLASVPDALLSVVPSNDYRFWIGPLYHDKAYQTKDLSREDADMMLMEVSEYYGLTGYRAFFGSLGVRIGGSKHYNDYKARDSEPRGGIYKLGFIQKDGSFRV